MKVLFVPYSHMQKRQCCSLYVRPEETRGIDQLILFSTLIHVHIPYSHQCDYIHVHVFISMYSCTGSSVLCTNVELGTNMYCMLLTMSWCHSVVCVCTMTVYMWKYHF